MFGIANQLLAVIALAVVTTVLVNAGRAATPPLTLLPMLFVASTTLTTAYLECTNKYLKWIRDGDVLKGGLNLGMTLLIVGCVVVIVAASARCWLTVLRAGAGEKLEIEPEGA